MQFHGDVQGKIPRKWLLYGLTVVGTRWFAERWKTISALVLPESSLLMVCLLKYLLPYNNRVYLDCLCAGWSINGLNSAHFENGQSIKQPCIFKTRFVSNSNPQSTASPHSNAESRTIQISRLKHFDPWASLAFFCCKFPYARMKLPNYIIYLYTSQDLLMFTLPLVNVHKLRRWFSSWKAKTSSNGNVITFETNINCAACNDAPVIPQRAACNHIFCYYCLKVKC